MALFAKRFLRAPVVPREVEFGKGGCMPSISLSYSRPSTRSGVGIGRN